LYTTLLFLLKRLPEYKHLQEGSWHIQSLQTTPEEGYAYQKKLVMVL
jgi:hypothetical protein